MSDTVAGQDANKARIFADVVCPFCGTGCDDIEIHVKEGRIKTVENACAMGKAAYAHDQSALAIPRIQGRLAVADGHEILKRIAAQITAKQKDRSGAGAA